MKKYTKMFLMGATALFALSCTEADLGNEFVAPGRPVTLQASIESSGTRAAVDAGKTIWQAGDEIAVRLSDNSNMQMTVANISDDKTSATFTGYIVGDGKLQLPTVAVYPYSEKHNLTDGSTKIYMPDTYTVTDNATTNMVMKADLDANGSGTFKHLAGVIQFKIGMDYVPTGAAQFRFTTPDKQNITGDFAITTVDEKEVIKATPGDGTQSSVTIKFNAAQNVNNELIVNVPLPVGTYVGYKIDILDASGKKLMETFGSETVTNTVDRAKRVVMPKLTPVELSAGFEEGSDWAKVSEGVFEIYTKAGMFWFANQVNTNANTFKNQTVRLANNIDLENETWIPIGPSTEYDHEFQGTFDGNDKTISNLYCVNEGQTAGLFGYASIEKIGATAEASIKNVTIDHATVQSHHFAGAVAAWVQGGYTVQNCKVTNSTITSTVENTGSAWDNGDKVGGVVGYIAQNRTTVTDCSVSNTTITGYRDLGGVVGCVATATANGTSSVINNTIGENVKIVQDLKNSYKSIPSGIPCDHIVGRNVAETNVVSGNTGTATITVKAYNTVTAQLALDAAATARTIELAAGTYDELIVRHTKVTTQITDGNHYNRTLQDITIKAAEDKTVSVNGITISSGHAYTADASNPAINYVVKEEGQAITGTTNYNYFGYFLIRNLVIDGFTLTKNVYIGADSSQEHDRLFDADGITLQNCQMIGDEVKKVDKNGPYKLIRIGGPNGSTITKPLRIKNVVVRNCKAKQVFQGVYAYGPVDYTVEYCEFDDLGHNVFQVGAGRSTFQNNVIKNCNTDRLFRISPQTYPEGDWVKFIKNTIINSTGDASDDKYPFIKIGDGTGTGDITFEGNTMDGAAWNPIPYTVESDGSYTINNAAGLLWFANEVNVNGNSFSGKTVRLGNNINLKNAAFRPIGQTGATRFLGTFDGNNKTISNLNIDSSAEHDEYFASGLFGWTEGTAAIKNLTIDGATVKGHHYVAVVAGWLDCMVTNCHVLNANIECTHYDNNACGDKCGIITGYTNADVNVGLDNCSATDCTVKAGRDAGQLVGAGQASMVKSNCSATNVTVSATGDCTGINIQNELIGRIL